MNWLQIEKGLNETSFVELCDCLTALESLTRTHWLEKNTSLVNGDDDSIKLNRVWQTILTKSNLWAEKSYWFGGISTSSMGSRLCDKVLNIGLYIADSIHINDSELEKFLASASRNYQSNADLASFLLHNDERCINVLYILLKHSNTIQKFNLEFPWDARLILVEVFAQIEFDALVLLEWMQSEVIATVLISRILNDIIQHQNWRFWKIAFENSRSNTSVLTHRKTFVAIHLQENDDDIVLKINELAGEMVCEKTFRFSHRTQQYVEIPPSQGKVATDDAFINMLQDLKVKLSLGSNALSFKSDKISKKIEGVLEMIK